jgi:hypothetical protein
MRFRPSPAGLLALALTLSACSTLPSPNPVSRIRWPEVTFAALTDIHLYNPVLGTSGPAWDALEAGAYELFPEGPEIVSGVVSTLVREHPSFVLVTGDLTKDGERASHELAVRTLAPLRAAGIPVLVIPGNHDILNPLAFGYTGAKPTPVPSVTPGEFADLYRDFGYGSALDRDPASLSYLAEPVPGLRVLALDTCRYEENAGRGHEVTAGRIRPATWPWIDRVLDAAARDGVPVVVMLHHALVEKFQGQARVFRDYVVADQEEVQRRLARHGVQLAFTGHFHTLSAALATPGGQPILDIEDGTLAQYPLGFRRIEVRDGRLKLTTDRVTDVPSWADRPGAFVAHARQAATHTGAVVGFLARRFGASADEARILVDSFTPLYLTLVGGNPSPPAGWTWPPQGLGLVGSAVTAYLGDLPREVWHPNGPDDLTLDLPLPLVAPAPER